MIDTEALRKKVIDLAIQGKLTEQLPSDGDAETLYVQIQEEKAKLLKEGKIKKEKKPSEISISDIPFDIPDNWKWVTVSDIFNVRSAMRIHMSDWKDSGVPFFRGRDLVQLAKYGRVEPEIYISRQLYEDLKNKGGVPQKNDILVSAVGTLGKVYVVTGKREFYYKDAYILCFENFGQVFPRYVKYVIESSFLHDIIYRDAIGMTVAQMTITKANELMIPLPPIAEQKRIAEKIDNIYELLERIDDLQAKYSNDLAILKSKIIDAGIQGKLTEQLPEDGDAETLYLQIQEEKAKLIKEGKIKKEKPLPEIDADEIPFEIPKNWKWVRLSDVVDVRDGTHDTPKYVEKGYPLVTGKDFYNGYFELSKTKFITKKDFDDINKRSKVDIGDILYSMIGGNIGSMIAITKENFFEMAIKNVALFKQYDYSVGLSGFLQLYLKSQVTNMRNVAIGGAQSFVPLKIFRKYPFPLPPLSEQNRIVEKVNTLLSVIK